MIRVGKYAACAAVVGLVFATVSASVDTSPARVSVSHNHKVSSVEVRALNILGCDGYRCIVQFDPSQDAANFTGWQGTAGEAALEHVLGFKLGQS